MDVQGDHTIIRGNRLFNIGGSAWISDATGIYATDSVDVLDNTVSGVGIGTTGNGVKPTSTAIPCIWSSAAMVCRARRIA